MAEIDLMQFEGHTAGPWRVGADLRYVVLGAGRLSRNGMAISLCKLSENSGIRTAEYMPNAALIAAAPDLLAEVKRQAAEIERLKAALLWTLWRSQGGSSTIEQPLRRVLGIRKFEALTPEQIECAKRFGEQQ